MNTLILTTEEASKLRRALSRLRKLRKFIKPFQSVLSATHE